METTKEHKGIFEEKKKTARIMRNVFIVVAVVYVGLIIWSLCRHNYFTAAFDFVIMLMNIGYALMLSSVMSDADLMTTFFDYYEALREYEKIHPWISVKERLPRDEDYDDENIYCFLVRQECGFIYNCAFDGEEWLTNAPDGEEWGVGGVTHWMPIPQAPKV